MNEEKEFNINKELRNNYKKHFANKTALVSFLALVIVACLALGFVLPITLIITVPLLLIPIYFGFVFINSSFNIGQGKPSHIFSKGFRLYFTNLFYGCFKIFEGILKFFIMYLISNTICTVIFHFTIGVNDPTYMSILESILSVSNTGTLSKLIQDLQANSTYMHITNLTEIISFGLGSYLFIHHVITQSFKLCFAFSDVHIVMMSHINAIHRKAFPKFRKEFYLEYYSSFWLIILLFVLGYAGGSFIGYLLLNRNGVEAGIIGLALGNILSLYFLPYIYDSYQVLYSLESRHYYQAFLNLDGSLYFQNKRYIKEAEREVIQKMIDDTEELLKKDEQKTK